MNKEEQLKRLCDALDTFRIESTNIYHEEILASDYDAKQKAKNKYNDYVKSCAESIIKYFSN